MFTEEDSTSINNGDRKEFQIRKKLKFAQFLKSSRYNQCL